MSDCFAESSEGEATGTGLDGNPLLRDHRACYEILRSHDARFDGRIFVGCTSTGIYCRPICRVRIPREENCRFFPSAAAAEAQGFRPCLRCRPELAPAPASAAPTAPTAAAPTPVPADESNSDSIRLYLGYRAPYDWHGILAFLGQRAIEGVEAVCDDRYLRTVGLHDGSQIHFGWVTVTNVPSKNALAVTVSSSLLPVLPLVLARVRNLFDLNSDPHQIQQTLRTMSDISPQLPLPGARVPGSFEPFEMAVRAILGQQVTVKAARTLAKRLAAELGTEVPTPFAELTRVFPTSRIMAALLAPIDDRLGPLGITGARARSIRALAIALEDGSVELSTTADAQQQMAALLKLPGFGPWTTEYVAMRALGWPDAFPHTDYGVKKALAPRSPQEILELSQAWRPWRSYATINLWRSLAE
jgi:AraC family transcriptional regulator of adaptative response / DNA-3-methyladenine glycosylase II